MSVTIVNTNPVVIESIEAEDVPQNTYFVCHFPNTNAQQVLCYKTHGADLVPIIINVKNGNVIANMSQTLDKYQPVDIKIYTPPN